MRTSSSTRYSPARQALDRTAWHLSAADDGDEAGGRLARFDRMLAARDDLPYRVELWDAAKQGVERILAVAVNGSIGYAAFYAATRDHPDRYVTLRHNNSIVSRWNGPDH